MINEAMIFGFGMMAGFTLTVLMLGLVGHVRVAHEINRYNKLRFKYQLLKLQLDAVKWRVMNESDRVN